MKLVQFKYGNEKKLIVAENLIKRGFDFESNQDFFTDADEEKYNEYLESIRGIEEDERDTFREWLEKNNIKYLYLPESYISVGEMRALISAYKYYYSDDNDELVKSEEILKIQEVNFIEYWNGHELEQGEITDDVIDLELIESNIDYKILYGHYSVYKDKDHNLYLHEVSYYQGNLGNVEEVTEEQLLEEYDYKLNK